MALEKIFREFTTALRRLNDRLQELRITVVEDRPVKNDAVVVDNLEYAVEDLAGWLQEALDGAGAGLKATATPPDLDAARRALAMCQERFRRIEDVFSSHLVSYERMADLTSFGSERRGEWPLWVASVKRGIDLCRHPLEDSRNRLAECWQEIAERVGMTNISVHNTSIGQKIDSSTTEAADLLGEALR
jgi:hypothetical protein